MGGRGSASGKKGGGGASKNEFQVTPTSYLQDLSEAQLTPEQIWDINQQRRQMQSDSRDFLMHHVAEERPKLTQAMEWKYGDLLNGREDALKGVPYKSILALRDRAMYDLTRAHERVAQASSDVQVDAYKEYERGSSLGEKWADCVQELSRAQRVYDDIKAARNQREEGRHKRKKA